MYLKNLADQNLAGNLHYGAKITTQRTAHVKLLRQRQSSIVDELDKLLRQRQRSTVHENRPRVVHPLKLFRMPLRANLLHAWVYKILGNMALPVF